MGCTAGESRLCNIDVIISLMMFRHYKRSFSFGSLKTRPCFQCLGMVFVSHTCLISGSKQSEHVTASTFRRSPGILSGPAVLLFLSVLDSELP